MNDKTKEKGMGLVRNATVNTKEEYDEAKKRLDYYVNEYKWINEGIPEDKVKEIEDEARKIRAMIKINVSEDEKKQQEYYRRYYQILARKQKLIKSGKYASYLKQNIISLYAAIKQFEIDGLDYTLGSIIKGVVNGEKSVLDNLKTDRLLSRIRVWEGLPKEEDLLLQPADELLGMVTRDLVSIKSPQREEESNLPAISEGYLSQSQLDLIERVETFIHEAEANTIPKASAKKDIEIKEKDFVTTHSHFEQDIKQNKLNTVKEKTRNREEKEKIKELLKPNMGARENVNGERESKEI